MGIWVRLGTVSVENGSNVVTGALTVWGAGVQPGNPIYINGSSKPYEIDHLDDDTPNTKLYLVNNFEEATVANVPYMIIPFLGDRTPMAIATLKMQTDLVTNQTDVIETNGPPNPNISPGNIGNKSLAFDSPAKKYYHLVDGVWTGPFDLGGSPGWTPIFAIASDGNRRVYEIVDWTGGDGTKPAVNKYVGPTGLVDAIGDGVDVRGPQGIQGQGIQPNASGTFSGRSVHDGEAQSFIYLSTDGDGGSITTACLFVKNSATSGDWSVATPIAGTSSFQRVEGNATYAIRSDSSKLRDIADLRDWNGLDLTDTHDNASLVQSAINSTASSGDRLYVPQGKIALDSTINVGDGSRFKGNGRAGRLYSANDTFFHIAHTGVGFLLQSPTTGNRGIELDGINTYRDQPASAPSWAPNANDFDIKCMGANDVVLRNIMLLNPTKAIQIVGDTSGSGVSNNRFIIENIMGQPYQVGMDFTHIYDVLYMDAVHWWPFKNLDTNIVTYTRAYLDAFRFGRIDNPQISRIFSWGSNNGMHFNGQADVGIANLPAGTANLMAVHSAGMDNCTRGILIDGNGGGADISFGQFYCASDSSSPSKSNNPMVFLSSVSNVRLQFEMLNILATTSYGVLVSGGSGNKIIATGYTSTDVGSGAGYDFSIDSGSELVLLSRPAYSSTNGYNTAATGKIKTPDWIAYTPTVSAISGSLTSASATGRYKFEGNTVTFEVKVTITTNGTGASAVNVSLPKASKSDTGACGREIATTGKALQALIGATGSNCTIYAFDNTYPGGNGAVLVVWGQYEVQ